MADKVICPKETDMSMVKTACYVAEFVLDRLAALLSK